ncbi:MAG: hypothetical protein RLP44_04860 [Aggregatilineales bacterium]
MSEEQPIKEAPSPKPVNPRVPYIIGGILLFVGLYISAFLIPDVIKSFGGPQTLTLAEAVEVANAQQTYARIEDGTWDCATLTQVQGRSPSYSRYGVSRTETRFTEIFYTADAQEIVMFVTLSGEVDCADLDGESPEGYLYSMSNSTRRELTNGARLARYFTTDTFLELCGYCGQENSLIGAVFGITFTLLGVAVVLYGRKLSNAGKLQSVD